MLIPDTVTLEWVKGKWVDGQRVVGDEWMATVERWFEVIEPALHSFAVGRPVGQIMRAEIEGDTANINLVSEESTGSLFMQVAAWKEKGRAVIEEMREGVEAVQLRADQLRFDHDNNKSLTVQAFEAIESVLTADEVSRLRTPPADDEAKRDMRAEIIKRQDVRDRFAPGIASFYGADVERVTYLLARPTVTYCFAASALSLALRDIQGGSNTPSRNAAKVTNDIVDADIATTASQAAGFICFDNGAIRTYSDLCRSIGVDPVVSPDPGEGAV